MRRVSLLLAALVLVAACSSGGGKPTAHPTTTLKPVPAPLSDFLAQVKPQGSVSFTATFHVLRKLGGTETDVHVVSTPPTWTITAGDVRVSGPPRPSTTDEARLSPTGVFSNFYSSGPAAALTADARRPTADAPVFSQRTVAGVPLHCVSIPQAGVTTQTACLTADGVFGYVDNAAVHVELTRYEVTAGR